MKGLNEDVILEYLVENIDKDLVRAYPIKAVIMLDYCYKKGEQLPKDHFSGFTSKILNKQINTDTKMIKLDESDLIDCLFIESYGQLLPENAKALLPRAKTAKDYKAIIAISELSKNMGGIINPSSDLDSKLFYLARSYAESGLEQGIKKEYDQTRRLSIQINSKLRKPLNKELAEDLDSIKKEITKKFEAYSKYPYTPATARILDLLKESNRAIDTRLRAERSRLDEEYYHIKTQFENGVWDNEKRISKLIRLRPELKETREKYCMALCEEGGINCESLDLKIKETIERYEHIRDVKEEFEEIKRRISGYYEETEDIFSMPIEHSSMQTLNALYSDLIRSADKKFPDYIQGLQEKHRPGIEKILLHIKQKCTQRISYLIDQSARCRQKIDRSFFSWQTKKLNEELEKYNLELGAWSKCQIV